MEEGLGDVYTKLPSDFIDLRLSTVNDKLLKCAVPDKYNILDERVVTMLRSSSRPEIENPRRKKTCLNRKQKVQLAMILKRCPRKGWDYKSLEGLRQLWCEYMKIYLDLGEFPPVPGDSSWANFSILLAKADYQGAELTVISSKCPSLVGLSGTCVIDSKNTFIIVLKNNKVRIIPKENAVFEFILAKGKFMLFGKYLVNRPADRTTKKIRANMVPVL